MIKHTQTIRRQFVLKGLILSVSTSYFVLVGSLSWVLWQFSDKIMGMLLGIERGPPSASPSLELFKWFNTIYRISSSVFVLFNSTKGKLSHILSSIRKPGIFFTSISMS